MYDKENLDRREEEEDEISSRFHTLQDFSDTRKKALPRGEIKGSATRTDLTKRLIQIVVLGYTEL